MHLSIITINYNNKDGLNQTINSVLNQTYTGFEYIIIDGGSTDGSVDIITYHSKKITYWISEKDQGIYNAINKGIDIAKNDYVFFLNSGDLLYNSEVLEKAINQLSGEDIIYGNLLISTPKKKWLKTYPSNLSFTYFLIDSLPHSGGVFILRKSFRENLMFYDNSLKIVADWKWFIIALFKENYSYKYLNEIIGIFDFSGISARLENQQILKFEKQRILDENFPRIYNEMYELINCRRELLMKNSSRYLNFFIKLRKILPF